MLTTVRSPLSLGMAMHNLLGQAWPLAKIVYLANWPRVSLNFEFGLGTPCMERQGRRSSCELWQMFTAHLKCSMKGHYLDLDFTFHGFDAWIFWALSWDSWAQWAWPPAIPAGAKGEVNESNTLAWATYHIAVFDNSCCCFGASGTVDVGNLIKTWLKTQDWRLLKTCCLPWFATCDSLVCTV